MRPMNDRKLVLHGRFGAKPVEVTVRIHGTQDLADPNVRTYEPTATLALVLRRSGRCIKVRERRGSQGLPSP